MKTFVKRAAIVAGVLFTALLCCGIVYINSTLHYFTEAGGLVQMWVNTNFVFNVDTNTGRVGWGATNTTFSFRVLGKQPATNATGSGNSALSVGGINLVGAQGGGTFATTTASGGQAGSLQFSGGVGGDVPLARTNATGGNGGQVSILSGNGSGNSGGVATNATTGGNGGVLTLSSGNGGSPNTASTNTVGGNGGGYNMSTGSGGTPTAGWARKGGNGGFYSLVAGNGGSSVGTNGGTGGTIGFTAGNGGSATSPGNAGTAGDIDLIAGNGSFGVSNSNGGRVYITGGTGAISGDVVIGRTQAGAARGGLVVGISNSAALTNVMFVRTNLDFPSTLAQTDFDIPVLNVAGVTNAVVGVGVPASALLAGSIFSGFCSNGLVFVRLSVYGALAKDPGVGDFEVEVKTYR